MKRVLIVLVGLSIAGAGFCAQPTSIGNVKAKRITFDSYTIAEIDALTPDTTNQWVGCSNCTQTAVCVSSGSNTPNSVGAFVVPITTGTFVGANYSAHPHCR